jgi:uncharacterized Zn-binding protein involved in type VI secretion
MAKRAIIRIGDPTSHGGTVLEGFPTLNVYGKKASGVGHHGYCRLCRREFVIVAGAESFTYFGKNVAVEGMYTSCGAVLIATQGQATVDDMQGEQSNRAPAPSAAIAASSVAASATSNTASTSNSAGFDQHFFLTDEVTGEPLTNRFYRLTWNGRTIEGHTDDSGLTERVEADSAVEAKIEIYPEGWTEALA